MKKFLLSAVVLSFVVGGAVVPNSASAAVIYDEAVDGELGAISINVGVLALGSNQIVGSLTGTPPADSDNFFVTLPETLQITSITISFDALEGGEVLNTALFTSSNNLFDDNFGSNIGSGTGFSAALVDTFGGETGSLFGAQWNVELNGSVLYNDLNWTMTFNTELISGPGDGGGDDGGDKVPAPATLPLILFGLAGTRWLRKIRH